jgi:hypothetical protein
LEYQESIGLFDFIEETHHVLEGGEEDHQDDEDHPDSSPIWYHAGDQVDSGNHEELGHNEELGDHGGEKIVDLGPGPYFPLWETSPVLEGGDMVNVNALRGRGGSGTKVCFDTGFVVIGNFDTAPSGDMSSENRLTAFYALLLSTDQQKVVEYQGDPMSQVFFPIFDSFENDRSTVAVLSVLINWKLYFKNILPKNLRGIVVVLNDSCGSEYTYVINGEEVESIGAGDMHDHKYDDMKKSTSFALIHNIADGTRYGLPLDQDHCNILLDVYPSNAFYEIYSTNTPIVITFSVAIIFVFTAFMFLVYDRLVERRQALILKKAEQTAAIVSSLFPANVRDRLMQAGTKNANNTGLRDSNHRLKSFLDGGAEEDDVDLQPIADLFPNCTVLFADIAGFTAWSSSREPTQVFILLQTVYQAFDAIAKRRRVFKVETIGDSYVAVTGLPGAQPNHAVIMAR